MVYSVIVKDFDNEKILKYLFDTDKYLYSWNSLYYIKSFKFNDEIELKNFFQKCNEKTIISEYSKKYNIHNYKGLLGIQIDSNGFLNLYYNEVCIYRYEITIFHHMYYIPKIIENLINDNKQIESVSFNYKIKNLKSQLQEYYKYMIFNQNDTVVWFKEKCQYYQWIE